MAETQKEQSQLTLPEQDVDRQVVESHGPDLVLLRRAALVFCDLCVLTYSKRTVMRLRPIASVLMK